MPDDIMEVVSEEGFLSQYGDGVKSRNDYSKVMELEGSDSITGIARQVKRSRLTVSDWINNGAKPRSVMGLETIMKYDLVPLDTESPNFQAFGELYIATVLSGSVFSNDYGHHLYLSPMSDLINLGDYFKTKLRIDFSVSENATKGSYYLNFDHYNILGKVLVAAGYEKGSRDLSNPIKIPDWFSKINMNNDLLEIIFSLKGYFYYSDKGSIRVGVRTPEFLNDEDTKDFADFLENILKEGTGLKFNRHFSDSKGYKRQFIGLSNFQDAYKLLSKVRPRFNTNLNNMTTRMLKLASKKLGKS